MEYKDLLKEKYDIQHYKEPDIKIPDFTGKNGIILLVGTSGSGKTTILEKNGLEVDLLGLFDKQIPIIDNFSTPENAEKLLLAVGLRSIPTWFRPINKVSNGERHRAEIALSLDRGTNTIDEFTSVVDRNTAKSLSYTLRKYFKDFNMDKIILASCHHDIVEWLQPDYIYDTDMQEFQTRRYLRKRPKVELHIVSSTIEDWVYFKKHHYLTSEMASSVHCYTVYWNEQKVAFQSVIHGTGGGVKSYWRGSRLVVLPEFQGLGIGKIVSETVANIYVKKGFRYFSKTAHPALGKYRNQSILWRNTSHNMTKRKDYLSNVTQNGRFKEETILRDANRLTYNHEFIGNDETQKCFKDKHIKQIKTNTNVNEWL